MLFYWAIQARN